MTIRLLIITFLFLPMLYGCGRGPNKPSPYAKAKQTASELTPKTEWPNDVTPISITETDWPWWRGPNADGAGLSEITFSFSESENVLWSSPVPGRGHASPTVIGNLVVLETCDEQAEVQSVIAFDRQTGEQLWQTDLFTGGLAQNMHQDNTHATSTIATDGHLLFSSFFNEGEIHVTALDLEGTQVWQTIAGPFHPRFGYAPSPIIYDSAVIVCADGSSGGFLTAINRDNGEIIWRKRRLLNATTSYSSPCVGTIGGKDQIVLTGNQWIISYDPKTGEENWKVKGCAEACVGVPVFQDDLLYASGGYPQQDTVCVKADGSQEVLWRQRVKVYVPSMSLFNGFLYAVDDKGIAYCWNAESGEEQWKERLNAGEFSASLVRTGERLIACSERGDLITYNASSASFEELSRVKIGDEIFSTPTIVDNKVFLRAASRASGTRQETLYCFGLKNQE